MRFLGYFLLVFVVLVLLRAVPFVGELFRVPLIGFFLAAALVSAALARVGTGLTSRRRYAAEARQLATVDTPHNLGKLGRLHELSGKPRQALEPLERAIEGEPEVPEWRFRLGRAHLALGDMTEAVRHLEAARELDEEHAYGAVLLTLAEAQRRSDDPANALATLERYEVLQGPTPESAFRRGQVHAARRDKERARAAYAEVGQLASQAARYQRAEARGWAAKATFARLFV